MVIWDNKQGDNAISVFEETSNGCYGNTMKVIVRINPSPIIKMERFETLCQGQQIELNPGAGFSKYLWQDGSVKPGYIAKSSGIYWVEVTNSIGCSSRDSVEITLVPLPKVDIGKDATLCAPDELTLNAGNNGAVYQWSNGSAGQTMIAREGDGQIWVRVTDANGCVGSDTIQILTCTKQQKLEIANAFTPNGDGHNDYWEIRGIENYPDMSVKVYDRWGNEVYRSDKGYAKPWDGNLNGKKLPTGVYYYVIIPGDGSKEISGSITLIR
jgi:gliding motility-associated-like protein